MPFWNRKSVFNGTETLSFLCRKLCDSLPEEISNEDSLQSFKSPRNQLQPICPCRICKEYVEEIAFVQFRKAWFLI